MPRMLPAPGLLSTTTGCPSFSDGRRGRRRELEVGVAYAAVSDVSKICIAEMISIHTNTFHSLSFLTGASAMNLKFLPVSRRVQRRNFKFINRIRIIKLLVLLMFPKFA